MIRPFLCALLLAWGTCAGIAQVSTIPEIEGPRAAYQRALDGIRAERDAQTAPTKRAYAERLEDLKTRLADEGDAAGAEAVRLEAERLAKGIEPTAEERRKMTGLLLAVRFAYEKSRGVAYIAAAKKEAQAHAAWATGLGQLEEQLTRQGQAAKVAIVKAERARLAQTAAAAHAAAAAPPPAKPVGPTLDAAFAEKIKTAIEQKKVVKTAFVGLKGGQPNVPDDGAVLLGFELSEYTWKGSQTVKALDPIFLTTEGIFRGVLRGKHSKQRSVVQAPDGYALGALNVYTNERIAGLQIIFMKFDPATGTLDPQKRLETKWYGTKGEGEPTVLGGDGHVVVGLHGSHENAARAIGLVMMP
jgi:hypothetical protein